MRSLRLLTDQERGLLEADIRKAKDASEWRRLFIILSYDEGQPVEELAVATRLSKWTVEDYLKKYSSSNKTKNDPRGGKASKLNDAESTLLRDHLTETTYLKVKDIVAYVESQFQKKYSRTGMTAWLKKNGFTFKKPEKVPGKLDLEKQAGFIEAYQKIKGSLAEGEELCFLDAVHPEYQSQAVCGWIKKGECKTIQTTGKQTRLHFTGAIWLSNMEVFVREYTTIDSEAMIDFFQELEKHSKANRIHVILDNARAYKNHRLDEYLKSSKIELHYLPPYSPNLNPIERLWRMLREKTFYNRYYATFSEFAESVRGFLNDGVHKMKDVLNNRISDDFQIMKLNPIKLA